MNTIDEILKIIDTERSRYKVAVALSEWHSKLLSNATNDLKINHAAELSILDQEIMSLKAQMKRATNQARIDQVKEIRDEWGKWLMWSDDDPHAKTKIQDIVDHCNLLLEALTSGEDKDE